ncbi:FKBP-type peptidyl-prolyl cis-trans isomerase [Occallatibacter riparius]|uniref:Peptidyl-prolyl cis-trans isomerase n=1 Tax=Occallatibacter riparius TaxID=1002689 RepID=A0A9J7BP89_9BACT|nr:FKBP-type peptidyl-prolyl cis-trans isomerase [Occallatibacter riparius]UWZ84700.1 FKBP-type peptidyl-prolyl cis-trans isomerase [Occallatibacter riparius]
MKSFVPFVCLAAAVAVTAQTAPKAPAASTTHKAATTSAAKTAAASTTAGFPTIYKVPADEKRVVAPQKKVAVLTYQDIKIGTGPEGESGKLWHVKYKGWRAADGVVFDSWENNKRPVMDKDGKPEMDADGKPKMGDPEPLTFPQGVGRLIPGFDYGVMGMKVGGKRRLFIPWQMAYGTRAMPDRPDHPGIPAKSDLIFDVELVEVTDMPAPPQRPMMPPGAGGSVHPQPVIPPKGSGATPQGSAPATPPTGAPPTGTPDATKPTTPPPSTNPGTTPPPQPSTPPQPK